ncbi:MAG: pentapeptide repeat-containing protein [Cyanobacteria bacterium P01_G01_bin.39]
MPTESNVKAIIAQFNKIISIEKASSRESSQIYRQLIFNEIKNQHKLSLEELDRLFQSYYYLYLKNTKNNINDNIHFWYYSAYLKFKKIATKRISVFLTALLTIFIPLWTFIFQEKERIALQKKDTITSRSRAITEAQKARFEAWNIIRENEYKTGSLGRIEALEYLNQSTLYFSANPDKCRIQNNYVVSRDDYTEIIDIHHVVKLDGIQLSNAHLNQIKLPGASLEDSHFNNTDLVKANLCEAYLYHAEFKDADLTEATLINTHFTRATLENALLRKADLTDAKLQNANLTKVDFQESILTNVDFTNAILDQSKSLWSAKLDGMIITNASLKDINLEQINFNKTDIKGVKLDKSILLGTNLSQVTNLDEKQLTGDNPPFLCLTLLPQDIQINPDRDCDRLINYLAELKKESTEEVQQYIDGIRKKQNNIIEP